LPVTYPQSVKLFEVGPRDGLQSESRTLATPEKIALINDLSACGCRAIEVSSFVSKDKIPQLADAEDVFSAITRAETCRYSALVANQKGLVRALNSHVEHIGLLTAASETFCKRNINCSIAESLERIQAITSIASENGIMVRVYISCAFDCAYEGITDPEKVCAIVKKLHAMNCHEFSLADTTGKATPAQVEYLIKKCLTITAIENLSMHFHDSYGQALANALASLKMGVECFDTSIAGIGGCNFSPGASGNLATEDLLFMLQGMGIQTGIDLDKLVTVGNKLSTQLGHANGSRVGSLMGKEVIQ